MRQTRECVYTSRIVYVRRTNCPLSCTYIPSREETVRELSSLALKKEIRTSDNPQYLPVVGIKSIHTVLYTLKVLRANSLAAGARSVHFSRAKFQFASPGTCNGHTKYQFLEAREHSTRMRNIRRNKKKKCAESFALLLCSERRHKRRRDRGHRSQPIYKL